MTDVLASEIMKALKSAKANAVMDYDSPERFSTGSLMLDWVLGGGLPAGRFTTLYGWESTGKSTIAQLIAAERIRQDGYVCYIDAENAYDPHWAENIGVKRTHFALLQPNYAEVALDQMEKLIESNTFDLIVWDSVAAAPWRFMVDASADDTLIGKHAIKWNQFYIRVTAKLAKTNTAVLMINQLREKIGVLYGDTTYLPGGKAHQFYASIKLKTLAAKVLTATINGKKREVGHKFHVKTTKNKTAPNGRDAWIDFYADTMSGFYGVDPIADLVDTGKVFDVFTNKDGLPLTGSQKWCYGDTELAVGRDAVVLELGKTEYAKLLPDIEASVRQAMLQNPTHIESNNDDTTRND